MEALPFALPLRPTIRCARKCAKCARVPKQHMLGKLLMEIREGLRNGEPWTRG